MHLFGNNYISLRVQFSKSNNYERITSLRKKTLLEPIIFADDTSVVIAGRNFEDFCLVSNLDCFHVIKCFAANSLVTNLEKLINRNL